MDTTRLDIRRIFLIVFGTIYLGCYHGGSPCPTTHPRLPTRRTGSRTPAAKTGVPINTAGTTFLPAGIALDAMRVRHISFGIWLPSAGLSVRAAGRCPAPSGRTLFRPGRPEAAAGTPFVHAGI